MSANKQTKEETGGPSPVSIPTPSSAYENAGLLNTLKEKLFSLECEKISCTITPEEYDTKKAILETLLKQAQGASDSDSIPYTHTEPGIDQTLTEPKGGRVRISFRIAIVLVWTWLLVYSRYRFSAEAVEFWIGTLLLPFLIAYAIAGAKQRRSWVKFSYWFLGLGILLSLSLTNQKSLTRLSNTDLLKELSGTKPLEENLPENERETVNASRAFFADIKAFRKSHDEQLEALEPVLGQLYTTNSFSNKEAMQRSLNAVDKQLSLDRETLEMLEQMPHTMMAHLDQTNLSDTQKKDYMKGFMKQFSSSEFLSARKEALVVEADWADSAHDLYGFAIQYASQIVVSKDSIGIASYTIRQKFNEKLKGSKGLLDKYLATAKKADDIRSANMKNSGITDADLGLGK